MCAPISCLYSNSYAFIEAVSLRVIFYTNLEERISEIRWRTHARAWISCKHVRANFFLSALKPLSWGRQIQTRWYRPSFLHNHTKQEIFGKKITYTESRTFHKILALHCKQDEKKNKTRLLPIIQTIHAWIHSTTCKMYKKWYSLSALLEWYYTHVRNNQTNDDVVCMLVYSPRLMVMIGNNILV